MKKSFSPVLPLAISFIGALCLAATPAIDTSAPSEDRPRLGDPFQEIRTTSINWPDLIQSARRERQIVPAAHAPPIETKPQPRVLHVLVDPGHGGKDLGAAGLFGVPEKELTLRIGTLVKKSLERFQRVKDFPIEVKLSREEDAFLSLRERVKLANEWPADLFVSIHGNSSEVPRARGFEVYFLNNGGATDDTASRVSQVENREMLKPGVLSILSDAQTNFHVNESSRFAETVFQALSLVIPPNGRGVRQAPFTVLSGTQMPALLIEVGYLTNRKEGEKLTKAPYLKRIAGAISSGIVEFAAHLRKVI